MLKPTLILVVSALAYTAIPALAQQPQAPPPIQKTPQAAPQPAPQPSPAKSEVPSSDGKSASMSQTVSPGK
jgi:hypothetical protein